LELKLATEEFLGRGELATHCLSGHLLPGTLHRFLDLAQTLAPDRGPLAVLIHGFTEHLRYRREFDPARLDGARDFAQCAGRLIDARPQRVGERPLALTSGLELAREAIEQHVEPLRRGPCSALDPVGHQRRNRLPRGGSTGLDDELHIGPQLEKGVAQNAHHVAGAFGLRFRPGGSKIRELHSGLLQRLRGGRQRPATLSQNAQVVDRATKFLLGRDRAGPPRAQLGESRRQAGRQERHAEHRRQLHGAARLTPGRRHSDNQRDRARCPQNPRTARRAHPCSPSSVAAATAVAPASATTESNNPSSVSRSRASTASTTRETSL